MYIMQIWWQEKRGVNSVICMKLEGGKGRARRTNMAIDACSERNKWHFNDAIHHMGNENYIPRSVSWFEEPSDGH